MLVFRIIFNPITTITDIAYYITGSVLSLIPLVVTPITEIVKDEITNQVRKELINNRNIEIFEPCDNTYNSLVAEQVVIERGRALHLEHMNIQ